MIYNISKQLRHFSCVLNRKPQAAATVIGSDEYPCIKGTVLFYQTECGVLVVADICGLPKSDDKCDCPLFAFHIHEGHSCKGSKDDPFAESMSHYNPCDCPHPFHAGDMPPLFSNNGYAFQAFLTNRFCVNEIIGRTVIIHDNVDNFTTQPSGGAGKKIACGCIIRQ